MQRILIIIAIVIVACIAGTPVAKYLILLSRDHHPSSEFSALALALRTAHDYWLTNGCPADFQPGQFLGLADAFFIYTNTIKTANAVFHCRFGSRRPGWPSEVLAITDEGTMIFISDKDGKVTISPDENGVDP
jgi:hypothetical protein